MILKRVEKMTKQNNLVLIDSSLWILALKRNCPENIKIIIGELLDKDLAATCGLVLLEILQGSKNKKEYQEITEELEALHYLETNKEVWNKDNLLPIPDITPIKITTKRMYPYLLRDLFIYSKKQSARKKPIHGPRV